ncbi:MAG TPA: LytTR family DNA-binding domain-containing protein, partial [Saprospiraceae bacterium]|nr:LytTR family DNA-binding domain-containing protein [Saprospiraceae bacterium]
GRGSPSQRRPSPPPSATTYRNLALMNCIIVEDEPLAAELIADYIGQISFLTLTHTCSDALQALEVVRSNPVDVIFLDVQMPKLSGMDFLKTLHKQPKIIITSAHPEFALEGFELRVTDYLLKPIEFSRFSRAVQKLLSPQARMAEAMAKPVRPYYFFTVNKRSVKIYLDEIQYIESLKDSVTIHTPTKSYGTHYQLGELEELMRSDNFLRIHRSFLVAVDKIESFSAAEVEIAGRVLPIGRSHKEYVMSKLGRGE